MDNLTHSLVGLAAAKAGLERLSPGATAVCIIAANLPDSDLAVLLFGDRWTYLHHHRGITHSIIGTLSLGILLPLLFYFGGRLVCRIRGTTPSINLKGLVIASLIVIVTHPLLDWTNNYGVRPFLPWNSKWFYGDFAFVIDPYIWLTLGGAAFLLTSNTKIKTVAWLILASILTYLVMTAPTQRGGLSNPTYVRTIWAFALVTFFLLKRFRVAQRFTNRVAIAAFCFILVYFSVLTYMHRLAMEEARGLATLVSNQNGESLIELAAMPVLADPFHWQTVFETDRATYRFRLSLKSEADLSNLVRYQRPDPPASWLVAEALKTRPARIFDDFARFPVTKVDPNCIDQALVQIADLRYTEPGSTQGSFSLSVPVECEVLTQPR